MQPGTGEGGGGEGPARELLLHIFQLGEYQYVNMLTYDMNASYFSNRGGATIHFHIIFL